MSPHPPTPPRPGARRWHGRSAGAIAGETSTPKAHREPFGRRPKTFRTRAPRPRTHRRDGGAAGPAGRASGRSTGARVLLIVLAILSPIAPPARADTQTATKRNNHVTVQAYADREALVPGGRLNLAVSLKMDAGWHVYWRSPGGPGLPTQITWTAPRGFDVARTRFPVPEAKYDKLLKETSFIHEGTALFLTPIRVPTSAKPGSRVAFKLDARWLACKKNCIPGNVELSLTLPVAQPGAAPKPAHRELFDEATEALPVPPEKAEHLKFVGTTDPKTVEPGGKFTAILTVEIEPKHHMQSHKPLEGLIPAILFVEPTEGFEIGQVQYPKAHIREDKFLGKLSEYQGKVAFRIPVEVDQDADAAPRRIRGVFQYQICTDSGTCFPPQCVTFTIPVRMKGGPAPTGAVETGATAEPSIDSTETQAAGPAPPAAASPPTAPVQRAGLLDRVQNWFLSFGYKGVLALAFLGGILLNLMPCVLPVVSLKILSFVKQAKEDRRRIFLLGSAYCAGILVFFGLFAVIFWQTDKQFGWGQQFQRPVVVLWLAALITALALSLFGVFTLFTPKVVNQLGEKAEGEGLPSAFFTGVLATVLGTACTAPLLSAAVGAASRFPPAEGAVVFVVVGVGMALPFFILSVNPKWLRFVPRPGPWMETFEALMGFLLLGTVVWLLYPLQGQLGSFGLLMAMIFLLMVALAVWVKGKVRFGDPLGRKTKLHATALLILALGWLFPFRVFSTIPALEAAERHRAELIGEAEYARFTGRSASGVPQWHPTDWSEIPWLGYKRERALAHVRAGYTVFVDYTADWCVNCKANLKSSIDRTEVIQVMKELNVVPYEADYTRKDPEIKADLKRFGRGGVPMYLVYSPGDPDHPQVLPELLTPQVVIDALRRAGPSRPRTATAAEAIRP